MSIRFRIPPVRKSTGNTGRLGRRHHLARQEAILKLQDKVFWTEVAFSGKQGRRSNFFSLYWPIIIFIVGT